MLLFSLSPVHVGPSLRFPLYVGAGVSLVEVARTARVDVDDAVVIIRRRLVYVNVQLVRVGRRLCRDG